MSMIVKRVYDPPASDDGVRVLVDRLWPRGLKKENAGLDGWSKDLAPSDSLRRWFNHDPGRWEEFCLRYAAELEARSETWRPLVEAAQRRPVTLLFAARDLEHNNAVALKTFLDRRVADDPHRGRLSDRIGS